MIFFVIVLAVTINLSKSDELNNNFKINEKDIVKFTRDDAKDVINVRDEVGKSLSINPIIAQTRSEVINATLNQLMLQSPVNILASDDVLEVPNVIQEEAMESVRTPNVRITKGIITRAEDLDADQVPLSVNSFATVIKSLENIDGQNPTPKVYFPPLQKNNVQQQPIKSEVPISEPSLGFTTNSDQDNLEKDESIFNNINKNKLSLQSLGLVGLLNLNNYFGISSSPSQEDTDLSSDEPVVSIPNVILPLESHNSEEPQSESADEFFVQPKNSGELFDFDQPTFESSQDYASEPKNSLDVKPDLNSLSPVKNEPQFLNNKIPTYEGNQQGELNDENIHQIQTDETNFKSESTNSNPLPENSELGTFLPPQGDLRPDAEVKVGANNLHVLSRSRAINNSPQGNLFQVQANVPTDQRSQYPQKLTWQSVQNSKVNQRAIENSNSDVNFQSLSHNSISSLNPQTSINNLQKNVHHPDESPVISLQPPGLLPYFSSLPNKSNMIPPNFNQQINILPDLNASSFPRQSSQPISWIQQNIKPVPHTAFGNQQFNILEKPYKSDNTSAQQVFSADFLPETSASTNVPSSPNKSVYTLKEHRTISDNKQTQQDHLTNTPTLFVKPDDSDSLSPNEQAILTFLKSQSELYDSQSQEQPIQFFPEPIAPEKDQLTVQSILHPSQPQSLLEPSLQPTSLEQPPTNANLKAQIDSITRYADDYIQPTESNIQVPKLDSISLETDKSEEIVQIPYPQKEDQGKPTEACSASTVIQERFVTVTVISKILETVRQPISTSFVTIRDHQTFTRTMHVPYVTNTVTEYIDNSRCPTSHPSVTRTGGRSLIDKTEVPTFPPHTSSYTDYFGDGNSRETLKRTLDRYENNYMDWVNKLKSRHFHIDKHGKPKNLMSLSYGEWPKQFVIDEQFWE